MFDFKLIFIFSNFIQGNTSEGGHYVSYARDLSKKEDNVWYYFDDGLGETQSLPNKASAEEI